MSTPTTWPDGTALTSFLQSTGLPLAADALTAMNLDLQAAAAVETFQQRTGWNPFLGIEADLRFDPPGADRGTVGLYAGLSDMGGGRKLFLGGGLLKLTDGDGNPSTTITTGITADNPQGWVLTLNQDFWLRPNRADFYNKPWTFLEFRTPQYGEPQSIEISGLWGRSAQLPTQAYQAVLMIAAIATAPLISLSISQGIYEWKRGDEMERYGGSADAGPLAREVNVWSQIIEQTVTSLRRTSIS